MNQNRSEIYACFKDDFVELQDHTLLSIYVNHAKWQLRYQPFTFIKERFIELKNILKVIVSTILMLSLSACSSKNVVQEEIEDFSSSNQPLAERIFND